MLYNANVTNTLYVCIHYITFYQLHIMHYLPAQVCTMSSPHQHCRGRRSGQQGDCTQVLRNIASGQPQGTQPRVAVTAVLWIIDSMYFKGRFGSFSLLHDTIYIQTIPNLPKFKLVDTVPWDVSKTPSMGTVLFLLQPEMSQIFKKVWRQNKINTINISIFSSDF